MPSDRIHIPLALAFLCGNTVERDGELVPCDTISNQSRRCHACASEVLMALAPVLNREEREEAA